MSRPLELNASQYTQKHFTTEQTKNKLIHKWLRLNQCYQSYRALEIYIPGQVSCTLNKTLKLAYAI